MVALNSLGTPFYPTGNLGYYLLVQFGYISGRIKSYQYKHVIIHKFPTKICALRARVFRAWKYSGMEQQLLAEVCKFYLESRYMQTYQHIRMCLRQYLVGSLVGKFLICVVLGLLPLVAILIATTPGA